MNGQTSTSAKVFTIPSKWINQDNNPHENPITCTKENNQNYQILVKEPNILWGSIGIVWSSIILVKTFARHAKAVIHCRWKSCDKRSTTTYAVIPPAPMVADTLNYRQWQYILETDIATIIYPCCGQILIKLLVDRI